ncbi:hypothetical protein N8I77_004974 [Diaporthe amygdali]|uniref:Uncharacterized protein n=1 Tax=Phomopsis amygdali TaxID=1214568 RepID=A0AAD9SN72_PHOAM|nr:hypothetical protein N8I77_004974 [Diaporthe amygdali]
MDPVARSIEERQQMEARENIRCLDLPRLGYQQSLRDLIEDDLQLREDGSIEMAALLLRRDEGPDSEDATIAVPSSEAQNESSEVEQGNLLDPDNGDESSHDPKTTDSQSGTKVAQETFWRRIVKRYCCPVIKPVQDIEAYIQHACRRRATSEQPKVVYSHKRRKILRQILLLHFIPVSVNFALLGLYVRQVLWESPRPTTNVLNALQFAAKIHETLMTVSLASVLLHHVRYRLLSSTARGLPLGLVTSPFRLLDLTYLWSQEFSAAWWSEKIRISELISLVVHVYLFSLAAILGPASAISMLPKPGEWEIAGAISRAPFYSTNLQAYIGGQLSDIYPQRITASFIPEACDYSNLSQPQTNTCPRYGLEDILSGWLPAKLDASNGTYGYYSVSYLQNITVQTNQNSALTPRTITMTSLIEEVENHETSVDVTTSPDVILRFVDLLLPYYVSSWAETQLVPGTRDDFLPTKKSPAKFTLYPGLLRSRQLPPSWKQPFVSSLCSPQGNEVDESGSRFFDFSQCFLTDCGPKYTVILDPEFLPTTFDDTGMGFINVTNLKISPSFTPSAAFIYTTTQPNTTMCLVKANWIDFTIAASYFPASLIDLSWTWQETNSERNMDDMTWFNETNPNQIIHLDLEWLAALGNGTGRDRKSDYSFFKRLRQACLDWWDLADDIPNPAGKQLSINCMTFGLAAGIAEGLSKLSYHFDVHALGSEDGHMGTILGPSLTLSPWTDVDPSHELFSGYRWLLYENWTSSTLSPPDRPGSSIVKPTLFPPWSS